MCLPWNWTNGDIWRRLIGIGLPYVGEKFAQDIFRYPGNTSATDGNSNLLIGNLLFTIAEPKVAETCDSSSIWLRINLTKANLGET